jgi:hypothetical protein
MSTKKTTSQESEKTFASLRADSYKKRMNPVVEEVKPERAARTPRVKKEKVATGPVVVILSALYGIEGTRVEFFENVKVGRKLTNRMVGSDPAPKVAKDAIITATIDGDKTIITVKEGEVINFLKDEVEA